MKIAFRADASLQIGTGHIMRCLTLADALAAKGADCQFICRAFEANLIEFIRDKGYVTHVLVDSQATEANPRVPALGVVATDHLAHSHLLGATQAEDAEACAPILAELHCNWLIVDHYSLDARWELALLSYYGQLMVIDDLADRSHICDLLLDQTFGRSATDYQQMVPPNCRLLCGSHFALLRPEFAALRSYSLKRRAKPILRELLITMGGVDKDNATGQVLQALCACALPPDCRITVVMGVTAPWLGEVRKQAQDMPWTTRVLVGVSAMAQLMADSDLAIGAAGATSWERCCLGLPTAMIVLADNQRLAARLLDQARAVRMLELGLNLKNDLLDIIHDLSNSVDYLEQLRDCASSVTDGKGCERVAEELSSAREK